MDSNSSSGEEKYFAYIYRDPKTLKVRYAGYGTRPGRAYSVGHNEKIGKVVEDGEGFEILIAGPYRDEEEARNIESALVSAHALDLNLIQQPGKKFHHLGVPNELGIRRTLPALDAHELGRLSGGALIVYCNLTTELKNRESKVGPTNFTDEVVFSNIQDHWMVKKFIPGWVDEPSTSPKLLIAVQGPPADRMVIGAAKIDAKGWALTPTAPWDRHVHRVPLVKEDGLDCSDLRGRRASVKFGAGAPNYVMLVDAVGMVLHGYQLKGKSSSE
jgi:hypothetical protein